MINSLRETEDSEIDRHLIICPIFLSDIIIFETKEQIGFNGEIYRCFDEDDEHIEPACY